MPSDKQTHVILFPSAREKLKWKCIVLLSQARTIGVSLDIISFIVGVFIKQNSVKDCIDISQCNRF